MTKSVPRLVRAVAAALDAAGGPAPGEHLLAAVSGGPDSTALLLALAELAPPRRLRLTAACIDHGLRGGEGAGESGGVAALAEACGVAFVGRLAVVTPGPDLEARARSARYRGLVEAAEEVGAARIVTGHTRDDQVETVLLRLLRGAGRRGLGGMRPARGRLLRPMLEVTRADVRRFLADRGFGFAIDRTNADLHLTRNRLRRLLVPFLEAEFNPRLGPALAALAERLRDEDDFLAETARARAGSLLHGDSLDVGVAREPRALARRIIRRWLDRLSARAVTSAHVERVLALAAGRGRGAVAIPGPARVLREGDRLVWRRGRQPVAAPFSLPVGPGTAVRHPSGCWRLTLSPSRPRRSGDERVASPAHALFDADSLPPGLEVRGPRAGDRVRLLSGGTRKLQDLLVDAKVPREARAQVAVVVAADDILWVAGVARGATAAIGPRTRHVVEGVLQRGVAAG